MKKIIAFALVLTMMLSMSVFSASAAAWDGTTASASLKGEGTVDSPYLVESAEDLKYIQVQVDAGTTFEGKYFKQTADIDLNNKEWAPIGERTAKPFIGLYDGNGFKIVNFYQTFSYRFGGLFAYMTTAADFTPGLINITLEGKMEGCVAGGTDRYAGALLGWTQQSNNNPNKIIVANCVVDVDMLCDATGLNMTANLIIGNVVARSGYLNIYNCTSYGDVTLIGDSCQTTAGGVVAYAPDTSVYNCVNYGKITVKNTNATKDIYCGGVVGTTASSKIANTIENCINYGEVVSDGARACYTGGTVGCSASANTTVTNCVNFADVTAKSTSVEYLPYAGGVLGYSNKEGVAVVDSFNSGNIVTIDENNTTHHPGGIVGVLNNAKDTTYMKNCTTTTATFKGWMNAANPATDCVAEADATVIAAGAKAIEDAIKATTSVTLNGTEFKFAYEVPAAPETTEPAPETTEPAPETTEPAPETTEPGSSTPTGDSFVIFAIIAVVSVFGITVVAKRREN